MTNILEQYRLSNIEIILAATRGNQIEMEKELIKRGLNSYRNLSDVLLYEIARANKKFDARRMEISKKIKF